MKRTRPNFILYLTQLIFGFFLIVSNQTIAASTLNLQNALLKDGYTEVPLRTGAQDYFFINAQFGNQTLYPFILDTGSDHINLDPRIMQVFNFKMTDKTTLAGGAGGFGGHIHEVTIPIFKLGNFISYNEKAFIARHPFSNINKQPRFGMISIAFLRAHSAVIDVSSQHLFLKSSGNHLSFADQKLLLAAGYKSIQLIRSPHNFLIINARINDAISGQFFLDSGSYSFLSLKFIKKHHLPFDDTITTDKGSVGEDVTMYKASIHKISVNAITWSPKYIKATDIKYIENGVGMPLAGVLGIDWMRAHDAIIDVGSDMIFIK